MASEARRMIERAVLALLVAELKLDGWRPVEINDGDGWETLPNPDTVEAKVLGLDDCLLSFRKGRATNTVTLVCGNGGVDMISDWSYHAGDGNGFNNCMERVQALIDAAPVRFAVTHKLRLAYGLKK